MPRGRGSWEHPPSRSCRSNVVRRSSAAGRSWQVQDLALEDLGSRAEDRLHVVAHFEDACGAEGLELGLVDLALVLDRYPQSGDARIDAT